MPKESGGSELHSTYKPAHLHHQNDRTSSQVFKKTNVTDSPHCIPKLYGFSKVTNVWKEKFGMCHALHIALIVLPLTF